MLYCSEPGRGTKSTRHGLDGSPEGSFIHVHNLVSGEVKTDAGVFPSALPQISECVRTGSLQVTAAEHTVHPLISMRTVCSKRRERKSQTLSV